MQLKSYQANFTLLQARNNQACSIATNDIANSMNKLNFTERTIQQNDAVVSSEGDFWQYHQDLVNKVRLQVHVNESTIPDDLRYYLAQAPIEINSCPIAFWNSNDTALSEIGKKYLSVIATSVPCERIFSKAGRIVTEARNRLTANHLQQLVFLGSLSPEDWQL
ncbi:uncharacterized protein [Prorops nasuta]|uniref:uncharacterized protein n=1 Tax=Prorops nasuta TaxID=863751 RepID=UPI0034CDCD14